MSPVRLLGVPIDSVGGRVGTTFMPSALRAAGVVEALGAEDLGDLDVLIDPPVRDPETGIVGSDSVLEVTRVVRDALAEHADPESTTVVLGGCCTLAVGAIAGLRQRLGEVGVVYVDGHLDLYDGRNSQTGEAADMPLAVALGFGPPAWVEAAGDAPLLRPSDVALLGFRDLEEARGFGSVTPDDLPGITARDTAAIRRNGPARTAADARAAVAADGRRFWVFVDLDVLDERVFPNDAPVPDGLDWPDLRDLLAPLVGDASCLGLAVACYNPSRDPDGVSARRIVQLLRDVVPPGRR
ncbi:MAG: arginase family protein [Actinomycetota bacterium]